MNKNLIGKAEAARRRGMSIGTLNHAIAAGTVRAVTAGKRTLVRADDIATLQAGPVPLGAVDAIADYLGGCRSAASDLLAVMADRGFIVARSFKDASASD